MKTIKICLLTILLISCSFNAKDRSPSSSSMASIFERLDHLEKQASSPLASSKQCEEILSEHYEALLNSDPNFSELKNLTNEELKNRIEKTFALKIQIHDRLSELTYISRYYNQCLYNVNQITLALRYVEDYLISEYYKRNAKKIKFKQLSGTAPILLQNKKTKKFNGPQDLETGDILLTRAKTFGSASIARIGSRDSQFSHLAMVYKDRSGKIYTIESLIEHGLIIAPLKKHLKRKHLRTVIFRHKDRELGKKAAKLMYAHAKKLTRKNKVHYDFSMNYRENSNYFCSEVIHHAYKMATNNEMEVPYFKTKIKEGVIPFLQNIGVNVTQENYKDFDLFAPSDLQFDHRFDIIAEWRNPKKINDLRTKDMVLSKIFHWMERENYVLEEKLNHKALAVIAKGFRNIPIAGLVVKNLYPANIKLSTVRSFLVMDAVAKKLYKHVEKEEKLKGAPLSFAELFSMLEDFKNEDYRKWKAGKKSKFHGIFHPKDE